MASAKAKAVPLGASFFHWSCISKISISNSFPTVFATSSSYNWGKIVSINNLALKDKAYFDINNPYSSSKAMYWGFLGYKSASLTSLTLENLTKAIIDENYEAGRC